MSSKGVEAPVSGVDPAGFRTVCGRFATGITVVTVMGQDGIPYGMTANSFTSVSLEPPLVLVCVDRNASMLGHLQGASAIGINILEEGQRDLSGQFARRCENRFEQAAWRLGELGVPVLDGTLGSLECEVRETIPAGDHFIFLAEARVVSAREGRPLLYFASRYETLR